jgi:hypothetical protein
LDKLATTLFAAVIAKILFETLFKDIKWYFVVSVKDF